jgi:hypothetical protein
MKPVESTKSKSLKLNKATIKKLTVQSVKTGIRAGTNCGVTKCGLRTLHNIN